MFPVSEFCRWNDGLLNIPSRFDKPARYKADQHTPLVYHIYGDIKRSESMVLTEKDYFDFVIYLNQEDEKKVLPAIIRQELSLSSLLFIGYSLYDINFRAIFQGALSFLGRKSRKIRHKWVGRMICSQAIVSARAQDLLRLSESMTIIKNRTDNLRFSFLLLYSRLL